MQHPRLHGQARGRRSNHASPGFWRNHSPQPRPRILCRLAKDNERSSTDDRVVVSAAELYGSKAKTLELSVAGAVDVFWDTMLYGPAKQAASNEELLEALLSKRDWTEEDMAWLRLLASRTTASTAPKTAAAAAASHLQGAQQQDDTGMVSDLPHASDVPDVASASHLLHAACRLVGLPHTATQPPTSSKAELVITPHTQGITIDDAVLLAPAGLQPSATSLQLPPVASTDAASNGVHAPMLTQHAVHASPGMAVLAQLGIGRDVLAAVVAQNSYVESSEDAALCALRQDDTPLSVAGLWPHYALLNHSCMPNTSHVLVGGGLCLHAVRPITAGEELTTCYLGLQRFSHVASRRELLRASHGFHCRCPRCQAEHAHFPTRRYMPALEAAAPGPGSEADTAAASLLTGSSGVWFQGMLDGVFGKGRFRTNVARDHMLLRRACDELQPQLKERVQEALTAPSRARQQQLEVAGQIQGVLAAFDAEAEFLSLTTRGSVILRSSLLPLQQALLELDDHARVLSVHERIGIVEQCVKECEGVAAGSSLHVVLAARLAALSRGLYGQGSPAARQAELRCAQAHVARYSADLSVAVLGALVKHHELQAMGTALAAQINVLAWDVATSDGNLSRGMGIDRTPET